MITGADLMMLESIRASNETPYSNRAHAAWCSYMCADWNEFVTDSNSPEWLIDSVYQNVKHCFDYFVLRRSSRLGG
jgi:hypothetical protein